MRVNRIRIFLSVLLAISLLLVLAFAVWACIDLRRESEALAAQPGTSGVDFLGFGVLYAVLAVVCVTFAVCSLDIYWCFMYFLTADKRTKLKKVMNTVSLVLSLISLLSVPLFFITHSTDTLLVLGFFWSLICPIYRLVYLGVASKNADKNEVSV